MGHMTDKEKEAALLQARQMLKDSINGYTTSEAGTIKSAGADEDEDEKEVLVKFANVYVAGSSGQGGGPGLSANSKRQAPYAAPLTTLSDEKIPNSQSEIFNWCRYMYTFDPLISGAINVLAQFPITEITLEDADSRVTRDTFNATSTTARDVGLEDKDAPDYGTKEGGSQTAADKQEIDKDILKIDGVSGTKTKRGKRKNINKDEKLKIYEKTIFDDIEIYKTLIQIGIDYNLYGNCFILGIMGKDSNGDAKWQRMIRLNPDKVTIDYNAVSGEKIYKWEVPEQTRKIIREKSPQDSYEKMPEFIKKAVIEGKSVVLDSNYVYHFSRANDSGADNAVWGIPLSLNVMKLVMYRNILRQAQEAVAREHIVPFRIYSVSPVASQGTAPVVANYAHVAETLSKEIRKSVNDPNYKVVSPFPVNVTESGGNGRTLLVTPEIEQIQNEILAGMNVPREFLFGGISYSGSNIALKISENNFITYRLLMSDFLQNFIIKKMAQARHEWRNEKDDASLIVAQFTDLKMQDDVQQKELMLRLNQAGKVTNETLWQSLGIDPDKQQYQLEQEQLQAIDLEHEMNMKRIEYQHIQQLRQIELQVELQVHEAEVRKKMIQGHPELAADMAQQQAVDVGQQQPSQVESPVQELAQEQGEQQMEMPAEVQETGQLIASNPQSIPETNQERTLGDAELRQLISQASEGDDPEVVNIETYAIAESLASKNPSERFDYYELMPEVMSQKVSQLVALLEQRNKNQNEDANAVDTRPLPEQRPARRRSLQ